jgi:hypothetical protein
MGLVVWHVVKDALPLFIEQSACHQIDPCSLRGHVGSMTGPERSQHWETQGCLGHENGYLRVKFTYPLGKKFLVRTFIQRGEVDLDNVKADDSGLMTDSTEASYYIAYTCRWTPSTGSGQAGSWKCGCRDSACTQSYWQIERLQQ